MTKRGKITFRMILNFRLVLFDINYIFERVGIQKQIWDSVCFIRKHRGKDSKSRIKFFSFVML